MTSPSDQADPDDLHAKIDQLVATLAELEQRDAKRQWTDRLGRWGAYLAFAVFFFGIGNITELGISPPINLHPNPHAGAISMANVDCHDTAFTSATSTDDVGRATKDLSQLAVSIRGALGPAPVADDLRSASEYYQASYDDLVALAAVPKHSAIWWAYAAEFRRGYGAFRAEAATFERDATTYGFHATDSCVTVLDSATIASYWI